MLGEGPPYPKVWGRATALRRCCSVRLVVASIAAALGRLDECIQVLDEDDLAGLDVPRRDLYRDGCHAHHLPSQCWQYVDSGAFALRYSVTSGMHVPQVPLRVQPVQPP